MSKSYERLPTLVLTEHAFGRLLADLDRPAEVVPGLVALFRRRSGRFQHESALLEYRAVADFTEEDGPSPSTRGPA